MLAKPEKGQQLEGMLVNMARSGQIQQRLTEPELVGLLERVSDATGGRATGKVKVSVDGRSRVRKVSVEGRGRDGDGKERLR